MVSRTLTIMVKSTILVTGGAGYIGSACVKALLDEGHEVVVLDNLSKGRRSLVDGRASFLELDLARDDLSSAFSARIDAVIHFAAYKAVEESMADAVTYSDNIVGTTRLLNAMVRNSVKRIIFSSTAAVYGTPRYSPVDEDHPTVPESFYGHTKLAAERLMEWYRRVHGIDYVALRYFNVVGDVLGYLDPHPKNVVPIIMEAALGKREGFTVFGTDYETPDGTCLRDYIDLRDLVRAHLLALSLEGSATINLGTEKGTSVRELVALCKDVTGKDFSVVEEGRRPGDPSVVVASNARARDVLGWSPKVPLRESLLATWRAYQD